jgi:hypothetical protein
MEQLEGNIDYLDSERRRQADMNQIITAITEAIKEQKGKVRVPPPTEYDGSKGKLPTFLGEMKAWLEDNNVTNNQQKTPLTLSYMKVGEAVEWKTQEMENGTEWSSHDDFLKAIRNRFGEVDPEYTARKKLGKTKQIRSVEAYTTKFRKYTKRSGFSDVDLAEKYKKGLQANIMDSIYHSTLSLPVTLDQWVEHAHHFN